MLALDELTHVCVTLATSPGNAFQLAGEVPMIMPKAQGREGVHPKHQQGR